MSNTRDLSSASSTQDEENFASQTDLVFFSLDELEEIENNLPETSDDETGDDDLGAPLTAHPCTALPPGSGLGITISSRDIVPEDLISPDSETTSNELQQPLNATGLLLPFSFPSGPSLASKNLAQIQEIRAFFSISPSVPTKAIPSFFHNHSRITESVTSSSFLTRAGISARRQHTTLFTSDPARMEEIYDMLLNIDWTVEEEIRFSESDSDTSSDFASSSVEDVSLEEQEADWEAVAESRLNIIQLEDGDEAFFQQAVEALQAESFIFEERQQPRLQADPNSAHLVAESSRLRVELAVHVADAEEDDEDDSIEIW